MGNCNGIFSKDEVDNSAVRKVNKDAVKQALSANKDMGALGAAAQVVEEAGSDNNYLNSEPR